MFLQGHFRRSESCSSCAGASTGLCEDPSARYERSHSTQMDQSACRGIDKEDASLEMILPLSVQAGRAFHDIASDARDVDTPYTFDCNLNSDDLQFDINTNTPLIVVTQSLVPVLLGCETTIAAFTTPNTWKGEGQASHGTREKVTRFSTSIDFSFSAYRARDLPSCALRAHYWIGFDP